MIPFEALLPYGVIITFFTIAGATMNTLHVVKNNGVRERYSLDSWEKQLIERDYRLTGTYRQQSDGPKAPEEFKTSSMWKVHKPY